MFRLTALLYLYLLVPAVAPHGYVEWPPGRQAANATVAACGAAIVKEIVRDNTSHIEGLPEIAARDRAFDGRRCNLWLCRGIQFGDNVDNVQVYRPGQGVEMRVRITIPHDGAANVSVVNTRTNSMVGDMLKVWSKGYANEAMFYGLVLPSNNTDFTITMPDVSRECRMPGDCVLQWWWWGFAAKQTYESCVDFVMTRHEHEHDHDHEHEQEHEVVDI